MVDATKKQLVEFINSRCRVKGKKIPKTKLNQLAESDLMKIISGNKELEKAFGEYIQRENISEKTSKEKCAEKKPRVQNHNSTCVKGEPSQALKEELTNLVNQLIEDPTSFLAIMEFNKFISKLPYGSVDFNTLSSLTEAAMEANPGTAFVLLKYSTDQELFFQEKK